MASLCRRQCQANGFQVAQLADHDDIRVFTQGRAQCRAKAQRVTMNLALVDEAVARLVHEFDWVFDGQYVPMGSAVEVVDHGCQGCRLARARRPGNQHQPSRCFGNPPKHIAQAKLFQAQDPGCDGTQHHTGSPSLREGIDPKARKAG
ncbi:hypothetical protein D3C76_1062650 [compost metagenome]